MCEGPSAAQYLAEAVGPGGGGAPQSLLWSSLSLSENHSKKDESSETTVLGQFKSCSFKLLR